jgi:hypothetical protein
MTIEINQSDLLKELAYWHHKTDEECIALATSKDGEIDYEKAMMNIVVRDRCVAINNTVLETLESLKTLGLMSTSDDTTK